MPTNCTVQDFEAIGKAVLDLPKTFNIHRRIRKIWEEKAAMFSGDRGFD